MAETFHVGYNTLLKAATTDAGAKKTFVGVTSDSFQRQANVKESITKADAGSKRRTATSVADTWTVSGVCGVDGSQISRFEIIQLVGTKVYVEYKINDATGGGTITCAALVTSYSEETPADPDTDPTYSLTLERDGAATITPAQ